MPLFHCTSCHHEWERIGVDYALCDWCQNEGYIIATKTPLETMGKEIEKHGFEKFLEIIGFKNENRSDTDCS